MNQKKIVLLNPPVPDEKVWIREGRCQQWDIWGAPFPPFSLAMIATQLSKGGFESIIIDSGPEKKNIDKVIEEVLAFNPEMIISTTTSPTIDTDLGWFASKLKEKLPNVKIAAIGIHVSTLPDESLKRFPAADYIVKGEPELTCRELAESVLLDKIELKKVKGIAFRANERDVRQTEIRGFYDKIDDFGFPDWDKINFNNYPMPVKNRPFSLISFSRGCPYKCKFCATHAYNGSNLRKRSIPKLIEEIKYNLSKGVKDFLFWTELMTLDNKYLNDFLDAIIVEKLHKKICWVCNSRVDSSDYKLFKKMKTAGCWQIAFGFEFGTNEVLKMANKGGKATIEQGRVAATEASRAGLHVDGHFILGYPGETTQSMLATIDYACSLPLTFAHFYACVPIPGSRLYNEAVENNFFDKNDNWKLLNQDIASIKNTTVDPEAVQKYISLAYKKFYMSPKVMLRGIKVPGSVREYFNFAKIGLEFYKDIRSKNKESKGLSL